MERRVLSLQEHRYTKAYQKCANFDFLTADTYAHSNKKEARDIRKKMIKGYLKLLSHEIK